MKENNKLIWKRLGAYLLDLLLITMIISAITQLDFINPNKTKYNETYEKYMEYYKNVYTTNEQEENKDYANELSYELSKNGYQYTIVSIVIYIGYYVILAYFLNGQTLGKKIMKIKIVNNNDDIKPKIWQLLIRSLFIFSILSDMVLVISVLTISMPIFSKISMIATSVTSVLFYITIITILFKEDGRGIHDKLAKTKVINE